MTSSTREKAHTGMSCLREKTHGHYPQERKLSVPSFSKEKALIDVILKRKSYQLTLSASSIEKASLPIRESCQWEHLLNGESFKWRPAHGRKLTETSPSYQLQILTKISSELLKIRLWKQNDEEIIKLLPWSPSFICLFWRIKRDEKLCTFFTCHKCMD